jgi:hypothetical protein
MSYDIGTHIDLSYLNRKVVVPREKKSFQETSATLFEVGTQFIFSQNKAARRIPVVFA